MDQIQITQLPNGEFKVVVIRRNDRPLVWNEAGPRQVLISTVEFLRNFSKLPHEIKEFCEYNEMFSSD